MRILWTVLVGLSLCACAHNYAQASAGRGCRSDADCGGPPYTCSSQKVCDAPASLKDREGVDRANDGRDRSPL
jgi:hypothetical protein